MSVAKNFRFKATTIDVVYSSSRLDINRNTTRSDNRIAIPQRTRIGSHVATTDKIANDNRFTVITLLNVDGNGTADTTC